MPKENIDLTKLSIDGLKALAYDFLVQSQAISNNLKLVDAEIAKRKGELKKEDEK